MANSTHDVGSSEARLWQLVDERAQPGADTAAIDARIWDLFGEELAIMFTDLSGFSRQVAAFGITHFLQIIHEHKKLLLPIIAAHDGILVKTEADSFLVIFRRAERAVACAIAMQHACQRASASLKPEEKILLRVGLGTGRVLRIGDADVYGQEVNAASKLGEDTAKSNEILVTDAVRARCAAVGAGYVFEPLDVSVPGSPANFRLTYALAD